MESAGLWDLYLKDETYIPKHKALNFRNKILLNIKEYFLQNPNNNNREPFKLGRTETESF